MKHQFPFKRVFQQLVYREIPFSKYSWSLIESHYCVAIAKVFKRHLTGGLSRYKGSANAPYYLRIFLLHVAMKPHISRCCRNALMDSAWVAFPWSVPASMTSFTLCWKSCLHFFSPLLPSHGGWSLRWVNSRIPLVDPNFSCLLFGMNIRCLSTWAAPRRCSAMRVYLPSGLGFQASPQVRTWSWQEIGLCTDSAAYERRFTEVHSPSFRWFTGIPLPRSSSS